MPDMMRGIDNDIVGLCHWIGRKLLNHNPMAERDKASMTFGQGGKVLARSKLEVGLVAAEEGHVFYKLRNGRKFMVSIREMEPEEDEPVVQAIVR